jgi:hypothetical protein
LKTAKRVAAKITQFTLAFDPMISSTFQKQGPMKLMTYFTGLVLLTLGTSCSTYHSSRKTEYDDRYYSLADANSERRAARKLIKNNPEDQQTFPQTTESNPLTGDDSNYQRYADPSTSDYTQNPSSGGTVINNYYDDDYDMDNYYDYMYSSRIRRFHRNFNSGLGYYNPYYTNQYYYNYNPLFFGNSIYSSYGFFNPYVPWGYSPGLNFGWNSYSGFYMNYGFGYSNPYYMYNNPWRWNTWGYNPWCSPFSYNPWSYNPWGYYGMNNMYGYSNMMLYNSMMYNPVYYNSYDNNTYVNTTVNNNYGPNTAGSNGGSSFKADHSLSSVFSQEIGQSATVNPTVKNLGANPIKASDIQNSVSVKPNNVTDSKTSVSPVSVKPGSDKAQIQSNDVKGNVVSTPGKTGITAEPIKNSASVTSGKTDVLSSSPIKTEGAVKTQPGQIDISGGKTSTVVSSDVKPGVSVPNQSGKQDLINSGVIRQDPTSTPVKNSNASNYSSAPVNITKDRSDNTPISNRPSNINPSNYSSASSPAVRNQQPEPIRSQQQMDAIRNNQVPTNSSPKSESGTIRNYDNYIAPNSTNQPSKNEIRSNSTQPGNVSTPQAPRNNYQQYQQAPQGQIRDLNQAPARGNVQPKQESQKYQQYQAPQEQPRNNNQQYSAPQNQQQPRNSYQQYQAPQNQQQPRNSYQQYQAPQNQQQPRNSYQQYQAPSYSQPKNSQQYETPQREQPRTNSYQSAPKPNYQSPSSPSHQYQAPSAPSRQYQAPQPAPRMESSPRQSAPSGGFRSGSSGGGNSGGGNSGGGVKHSSPRR